jgi:TPR repeat protein
LLWDGRGVLRNLTLAAHYFRLAAEHSVAESYYRRGICFLGRYSGHRDITGAIPSLKLSADNGSPDGQFAIACMSENAIGRFHSIDLDTVVRYYELCSDRSPAGTAYSGWRLQTGGAISIDFTVAADCFKKAADSNDADGRDGFGCCLERAEDIDPDIHHAVFYYRRAAWLSQSDGLYNYERCLEDGKRIGQDAIKYYRLSAEKENAAAENSFGFCLERGIGVHNNLSIAADFYPRAVQLGDADGANNFGSCLERARGVQQSIERGPLFL